MRLGPIRASGAQVPNFFVAYEEFLRSSFGRAWLELAISDWSAAADRLTAEEVATPLFQSTIGNQQSAMKTWSSVVVRGPFPVRGEKFRLDTRGAGLEGGSGQVPPRPCDALEQVFQTTASWNRLSS
jgi:hypothetical protein